MVTVPSVRGWFARAERTAAGVARRFAVVTDALGLTSTRAGPATTEAPTWDASVVIWVVWAVLVFGLVQYIDKFGLNLPHHDELAMIPVLTKNQPVTLQWLWSQHNEHRIVIPRLVYLAVELASGSDFRAGMYVNVAALAAMAAGCVVVARRLRGHASFADVMFPVIFLNTGQWENLTSAFQMCFVLGATLGLVMFFIIAATEDAGMTLRAAIGYGVGLFALPLFGGTGIGLFPAFGVWATVVAIREWRLGEPPRRRVAAVLAGATVATAALVAAYFVDYERPPHYTLPPSDWGIRTEAIFKLAAMAFGPATRNYWPIAGELLGALIGVTFAAGGARVVLTASHRMRTVGFLGYLGAMCSLVVGTALVRAGRGVTHLYASRYMTICAPLACALFFTWQELGSIRRARFVQMCLCGASLFLLAGNTEEGESHGKKILRERAPFVAELQSGVPLHPLAERHYRDFFPSEEIFEQQLKMLHDARIGMFKSLKIR